MPTVYIQNVSTGLVLDVKESNEEAGAEVIMHHYHGDKNQLWKYKDDMFYSKLNKELALDIDETNGRIILWDAHGGDNQKWYVDEDGTIASETGVVLDIEGGSDEPGAKVIPYEKHGGPNQVFRLVLKS